MTLSATPESRELSEARCAARARWAELLRRFIHQGALRGKTYATSWAARLGVSRQLVERWANPLAVRGQIAAGDLGALDPLDLRELLAFWLEEVERELADRAASASRSPEHDALLAATRGGGVAARVTETIVHASTPLGAPRWAEVEAHCAEAERWFRAAKLAARAAKERR